MGPYLLALLQISSKNDSILRRLPRSWLAFLSRPSLRPFPSGCAHPTINTVEVCPSQFNFPAFTLLSRHLLGSFLTFASNRTRLEGELGLHLLVKTLVSTDWLLFAFEEIKPTSKFSRKQHWRCQLCTSITVLLQMYLMFSFFRTVLTDTNYSSRFRSMEIVLLI